MGDSQATLSSDDGVLRFSIQNWQVWPAGLENPAARRAWLKGSEHPALTADVDLAYVEPLARRRLSPLARHALHVANKTTDTSDRLPVVFASRHGDLERSLAILVQLAQDEPPSPTAFSLSVHNATAGVHSIVRQDTSPSTALAAGEETLLWAWCEACLRLADAEKVLLVYVESPLPAEYAKFAATREVPHALAVVLTQGNQLQLGWHGNADHRPSAQPLSLAMLDWLGNRRDHFDWHGLRLSLSACGHVSTP